MKRQYGRIHSAQTNRPCGPSDRRYRFGDRLLYESEYVTRLVKVTYGTSMIISCVLSIPYLSLMLLASVLCYALSQFIIRDDTLNVTFFLSYESAKALIMISKESDKLSWGFSVPFLSSVRYNRINNAAGRGNGPQLRYSCRPADRLGKSRAAPLIGLAPS